MFLTWHSVKRANSWIKQKMPPSSQGKKYLNFTWKSLLESIFLQFCCKGSNLLVSWVHAGFKVISAWKNVFFWRNIAFKTKYTNIFLALQQETFSTTPSLKYINLTEWSFHGKMVANLKLILTEILFGFLPFWFPYLCIKQNTGDVIMVLGTNLGCCHGAGDLLMTSQWCWQCCFMLRWSIPCGEMLDCLVDII